MTDYNEVSIEGTITLNGEEYRIILSKKESLTLGMIDTFIKLKNDFDASQVYQMFTNLQDNKSVFYHQLKIPETIIQLNPVITKTALYVQNELIIPDLKKKLIKAKTPASQLTELGLNP